jgi:endonuclease/exonuclease/phosphatase family metal-dependent hydrolase
VESLRSDSRSDALRVASYNVHRCVGTDGRLDVDRVARVIMEVDADVTGLQEIDCGYHIAPGIDQIEHLQRVTGLTAIAGPTLIRDECSYGNLLFTRHSVVTVRHVNLSIWRHERRGAIDVDLQVGAAVVRVIVTHFGLTPWERRWQTAALLELLNSDQRPVTILCGDFNEWVPMWSTVRQLDAHFGRSQALRTFPARRPLLALDRIWIRPVSSLTAMWIHRSPLARVASDHLPICAALDPCAAGAPGGS